MNTISWPGNSVWPLWQKILFRFFFIYFILYTEPWTWLRFIPGANYILNYYYQFKNWSVNTSNDELFHVRKELVSFNGSGDTSYGWAMLWLYLSIAVVGTLVWSLADIKRNNYNRISYWFRIVLRYMVILNCFGYGIVKIFGLQMSFPTLGHMLTPLGDFLPMRFSWLFMGYSWPYQAFSGAMEVVAGCLMLFRRTTGFGTLMAAGVFINVMMMNLSYDIPVKLFSTHLVIMCLVLLAYDYKRILSFIFNRSIIPGNLYSVSFLKKWMRITRVVLKLALILVVLILPFINGWNNYKQRQVRKEIKPIREGIYEVSKYVINNDTIPAKYSDSLRWRDMVFERGGRGSVGTTDTMFWQRYRRGNFVYNTDTVNQTIDFTRSNLATGETLFLFRLKYEIPDSNTIRLYGMIRKDSVFAEMKRINRHFQLSEKQFHWVSEYNR